MILRVVFTLIVTIFVTNQGHAFDLDLTVEDDIRKNYNSTKLMKDVGMEEIEYLPDLPSGLTSPSSKSTQGKNSTSDLPLILDMRDDAKIQPAPKQVVTLGNTKISKGASFNVVSTAQISDWQTKGARVKFRTNSAINKKKYTIPAGTVFNGEVIESHQPQISCNGGLVVIRVRNMVYNGQTIPINAYVTKANSKKIFLNNIKGNRTYLKTMWKKGNWGRTLFNKMMTLTVNLGGEGSTLLLSPFPLAYGTVCLGLNSLTSPICAFFSKGGHVNIPAGSAFRIKLLDDAFID